VVKVVAMATTRVRIVELSAVVMDGSDHPEYRGVPLGKKSIPGLEASLSCGCGSWWVVLGCWLAHAVSSIGLDHERPHEHLTAWA